jgi:hypothetical protein
MTAVFQFAFAAAGETITASAQPPRLLRRALTSRSWRGRVSGWARTLFGSHLPSPPVEPTARTGGPGGEPPDESEIASCMEDPTFWMMVLMH